MTMRNFELPGRSAVYAARGMACTSQPLATTAALDILKAGGNALDAAIAACAVQCVAEPQSTGIGGDCFCLYSPAASTDVIAYNGSGRAPAGLSHQWMSERNLRLERTSPHAVIVPGAVDAWATLNKDYGKLPLAELLQPAIHYASEGFALGPRVARDFAAQADHFKSDANLARIMMPGGRIPKVGEVLRQAELATSLTQIANEGRDAFYSGAIAHDLVNTLNERGGVHTLEDFANAKGEYVTPITTTFRGRTIYECPPNGQGLIALLLLNIISEFDIDPEGPMSVDRIHLEIEACRLAYQARTRYLADPAHSQVPIEELLSIEYARKLASTIKLDKATVPPQGPLLKPHQDTVYISVVDSDRNVCSFINTLFWPFGSGITGAESGVVLTNRGEGFVLDPASPNCLMPGKRPLHTIIPGMVSSDDRVDMTFGVMGGEYQAMGHMQFLSRVFDFGCDVQQAQDLPRFMADPFTDAVEVESGIDESVRRQLRDRGHAVAGAENPIGGSQAIGIDWKHKVLCGGSDPRKDGAAAGY